MNTLHARHLRLEPLLASHAEEMFAVLSDPAIYEFENQPPQDVTRLRTWYAQLESRTSADGQQHWLNWLVRLPSGEAAGYVQATVLSRGAAYVAYELGSRYWRQGIASTALAAVIDELRSAYGVSDLYAVLKTANYRSLGLLRKFGFAPVRAPAQAPWVPEHDETTLHLMVATSSQLQIAVLNNVRWYEDLFAAHGLASQTDSLVWQSRETAPRFHSNLVVRSPSVTREHVQAYAAGIESRPRPEGWSLKDSYACLDLAELGYSLLFEADWIWRDPVPPGEEPFRSRLAWTRVSTPAALAAWERAWAGDTRNETGSQDQRQFPEALLESRDHAFFAGLREGRVIAGGIAHRSAGAVGLSNLFSPPEFLDDTWCALVGLLSEASPGTPIVGYERGDDLRAAQGAGFRSLGGLRVWQRQR